MLKTLYVFVDVCAGTEYADMLYQSVGLFPSIERVAGVG